jgi:hypothetical protein
MAREDLGSSMMRQPGITFTYSKALAAHTTTFQDSLRHAKEFAFAKFGVPTDAWRDATRNI